jgi:hypothetical protein
MLKMIIPKIPNNIVGHEPSSNIRKIRQFQDTSAGTKVKIMTRFAAVAQCLDVGLPLNIIHHAIPQMIE